MRNIFTNFLSIGLIATTMTVASAQGTMRTDGARITASGAPSIVLSNMHFANNTSSVMFTAANSNFYFLGNLSNNISSTGAFTTTFYNTIINKTGGSEIDVITDNMKITTSNQLTMTSGNVDMNNNVLSTWELGTSIANLGTLSRVSGQHFYRGFFQRWYPNAPASGLDVAQWDIPVGKDAASDNYGRVYYTTATSGGTIRTMFVPVVPFYNGLALTDNTNTALCGGPVTINNAANEGYWLMFANGVDLVQPYEIKLDYQNFATVTAPQCLRIIKSENLTSWMQEGTHGVVNAGNTWVTRLGQTGFPGAGNGAMFTIAGDIIPNPLPVELAAFNANCTSNSIMVNWTTASETGNDYFVLERSSNIIDWEIVATIPTLNGNSNQAQQYSYEDHVYGGLFYYRLNQVDINGELETYPPVTLNCNGAAADPALLNTYQNGDGQITVVVFAPTDMDYTLSLFDLHGQKISMANGMLTGGNNTIVLDATSLRDAFYLVNVQVGDKNLSRKIFVK